MSAPAVPTLATLVSEALNLAGYGATPAAALTTRAQDQWMEQIKNFIWIRERKLKSLQTSSIQTVTSGLPQYANPSDYASDLSLTFITGTRYGTAQAGGATSITLAAAETAADTDIIGKEIYVYSGTGSGQRAYITAYTASTKVATISPGWSTNPDSTSKYVIATQYIPLTQKDLTWLGQRSPQTVNGTPDVWIPLGDSSYDKYILYPVPYRNDSQPMVLLQRYYANLLTLDLAGTLMSKLYQNWRNVWLKGVMAFAKSDMDDSLQLARDQDFRAEVTKMFGRETYGHDMQDLQARVVDYP